MEEYFESGEPYVGCSDEHQLALVEDGLIGKTINSLTWKGRICSLKYHLIISNKTRKGYAAILGLYNNVPVAVQIMWSKKRYNKEMRAYTALNATLDENIEKKGIPKIFWNGRIFRHYGIAMTLFEETLYNRFKLQNKKISELSTLLIFKRAVCINYMKLIFFLNLSTIKFWPFFDFYGIKAEILEYLTEMSVLHNDINPNNLYLRGSEVFIGGMYLFWNKILTFTIIVVIFWN